MHALAHFFAHLFLRLNEQVLLVGVLKIADRSIQHEPLYIVVIVLET